VLAHLGEAEDDWARHDPKSTPALHDQQQRLYQARPVLRSAHQRCV